MAAAVYTPGREGTLASDMIAAARRNGRVAVPVTNLPALLAELAAGNPVIVFQNLGLGFVPRWHYAVAYGYDLAAGRIVLHSGATERLATPLDTFENTWARSGYWGLVVLPPDRLPVTATEAGALDAAAGIERARRPREAMTAYRTVLARWPHDFRAWMGLGNAAFAAADLSAAQAAFEHATVVIPAAPEAWNNLAYVFAAQGRSKDAVTAAQRAVALAPPALVQPYLDTLAELTPASP